MDIGAYGHEGDSTLFAISDFGKKLYAEQLDLPDDAMIGDENIPFFLVGDDAFPMGRRLMKPFVPTKKEKLTNDQCVFNYRLSRARRVVENAFGIMTSKWRVLSRTMTCNPERAKKIVSACTALHNYFMDHHYQTYFPAALVDYYDESGKFQPGKWRQSQSAFCAPLQNLGTKRFTDAAKDIRNALMRYFNSVAGAVSWQGRAANIER